MFFLIILGLFGVFLAFDGIFSRVVSSFCCFPMVVLCFVLLGDFVELWPYEKKRMGL